MQGTQWLNPLRWAKAFSSFLWQWTVTFPLSKLYAAAPATLALFVVILMVGLTRSNEAGWRRGLVESQLQAATQRGDKADMALLARRLLQDAPQDLKLQYVAASAALDTETDAQARQTIRRLALESSYGPAVFWVLEEQFSPIKWDEWSAEQRDEFGKLLTIAAQLQPKNAAIAATRADYLMAIGSPDLAFPEIARLAETQPIRALQGAALLRQQGKEREAVSMARRGLEEITKQSEKSGELGHWLLQAQLALFLRQYEDAIKALVKASKEHAEEKRLGAAMAEVLVLWSRDQASIENPTERFAKQLRLLGKAVELAPNHPLVVNDLMTVALQCADEKDEKVAQLRAILVQGVAPELAHFVHGTAALMRNDVDQATLHLEMAAKTLPSAPAVLNNLAVAISTVEGGDLERALSLVDAALKQVPDQPYFFETRAQILLRLERYKDAVVDFEKSLSAVALREQVHQGLSLAYEKLGQIELAKEHEKFALQYRNLQKQDAGDSGVREGGESKPSPLP